MTKFYTDGTDDFVAYHVTTDSDPVGFYTTDEHIKEKAVYELITHSKHMTTEPGDNNRSMLTLPNATIYVKNDEKKVRVGIFCGNGAETEWVNIETIIIPNRLFQKLQEESTVYSGVYSGQYAQSSTIPVPCEQKVGVNLYSADGSVAGSFSRANSAVTPKQQPSSAPDEVPILTAFGTYVRVRRKDYAEYEEALHEAIKIYGDYIQECIVKDAYGLSTEDKSYLLDKMKAANPNEPTPNIMGFAIKQKSVFMLNGETGVITIVF